VNRRTTLSITLLCFAVALLGSDATAEQKTLKEQLVGTWTLVSLDTTAPDGTKRQLYGANPKGILILDAGGRYALGQGNRERPKSNIAASQFRLEATVEELRAAMGTFAATFGTWSINEMDKILIWRYEIALVPNNDGLLRGIAESRAGRSKEPAGYSSARPDRPSVLSVGAVLG
jgi:hypothetical protein